MEEQITRKVHVNSIQPSLPFLMKTSHLFCSAKQVTGFYVKLSTGLKRVNVFTISLVSVRRILNKHLSKQELANTFFEDQNGKKKFR